MRADVTLPENPNLPAETARLENGSDLESTVRNFICNNSFEERDVFQKTSLLGLPKTSDQLATDNL